MRHPLSRRLHSWARAGHLAIVLFSHRPMPLGSGHGAAPTLLSPRSPGGPAAVHSVHLPVAAARLTATDPGHPASPHPLPDTGTLSEQNQGEPPNPRFTPCPRPCKLSRKSFLL